MGWSAVDGRARELERQVALGSAKDEAQRLRSAYGFGTACSAGTAAAMEELSPAVKPQRLCWAVDRQPSPSRSPLTSHSPALLAAFSPQFSDVGCRLDTANV